MISFVYMCDNFAGGTSVKYRTVHSKPAWFAGVAVKNVSQTNG